MIKKITYLFLFAAALCFSEAGESDFFSSGYARGGAQYLSLPRHAQSAGLSGSVVAWQEELAGFQYNPAILDAIGDKEGYPIVGSYSFMTLDRKHMSVDATFNAGSYLAAGLSMTNYSVGNIEGRDNYGNTTEMFEFRENAISASVAGRLQFPLSWGVTLRYLSEYLEYETANGFGLDLGVTYRPFEQLCVGVSGQNIGSYVWWSTGHRDIVLPIARVGAAGMFLDTTLTVALDVTKTLNQPIDVSFGIQYKLLKMIYFRGGFSTSLDVKDRDYRDFDFSLGLGMRYSRFGFDYACPITSSNLGVSHKISVIFKMPRG